jgi:hypothetical protein
VVGYLTRPFLPRGFRCLGECCLSASNFGTAETETFGCFYFDCAHCCRCFCIYFVLCLRPENPTVKTSLLQIMPPILTASTLPGRSYPYLLLNRSPCQAHHKETFLISKLPVFSFKNTASLGLPFLSYMYLINFIKLPYGGPAGFEAGS